MQIKLNSDKTLVTEIREKIKANNGYCCCALIHTPETKCMCANFRAHFEDTKPYECHCGLYTVIPDTIHNN